MVSSSGITRTRDLESDLLSIAQFARRFGVTINRAHYLRLKGVLPVRKVAGHYVVLKTDAERVGERLRISTQETVCEDKPLARTPDLFGPGTR